MKPILFFDMETFSEADIRKTGSEKYARDPSTEALMITWCTNHSPVGYIDLTDDILTFELREALTDPAYLKCCANMPFDRAIMKHVMGIEIPWEQCIDSHVLAYSLGFSGGLDAIGKQVGIGADKAKLTSGKKLILRFCKPQPKNHLTRRWTKANDPEKWQEFAQYAIRDTETMRELWMILIPYDSMSEYEWDAWRMTQEMNERGMPVDPMLVDQAIKMVADRKAELKADMMELTGLDNPNSAQQLRPWLEDRGVTLPNLQATTVDNALDGGMLGTECHDVLQMKRTFSQTAVTKWNSIKAMTCKDNTIKGMFTFMGASRTGRYASRGINLQNLRRPPNGGMDNLIKLVYKGDNNLIQLIQGEPLDFLARTVRGAITAPMSKSLVVSDLSSIESRILGWVTGCVRMNDIFSSGKDTYKDYATELFNIPYDQVTKSQRTFSKPPVLGAGYMMGGKGLNAYADSMGVSMTQDESQNAVNVFRNAYHEVPKFWRWIMQALEYTLTSGNTLEGYGLTFRMSGDFLFITLPSGRNLGYYKPMWQLWNTPIGEKMSFTYMGINRFKSAPTWERIGAHAGGVTENIIQAIARDVMVEWLMRIRALDLVGTVHDEVIAVVGEDIADKTLEFMNNAIRKPIAWAPNLLLDAEGFVGKHYDK